MTVLFFPFSAEHIANQAAGFTTNSAAFFVPQNFAEADAGKTGKRIVAGAACKADRNPAFQYLPHRKRNAKPLP